MSVVIGGTLGLRDCSISDLRASMIGALTLVDTNGDSTCLCGP
jgi:hypothetical protein